MAARLRGVRRMSPAARQSPTSCPASVHGEDVGAWLETQRQRTVWARLTDTQRERLGAWAPNRSPNRSRPRPPKPLRGSLAPSDGALRPYREGSAAVPRGHVEALDDGTEVRLGVWLSNTKARRAKLAPEQLAALVAPGVELAP